MTRTFVVPLVGLAGLLMVSELASAEDAPQSNLVITLTMESPGTAEGKDTAKGVRTFELSMSGGKFDLTYGLPTTGASDHPIPPPKLSFSGQLKVRDDGLIVLDFRLTSQEPVLTRSTAAGEVTSFGGFQKTLRLQTQLLLELGKETTVLKADDMVARIMIQRP